MYQWGRKDPFLANDGVSDHKAAASTLIWPDPTCTATNPDHGTIEFAIAHPTTYIYPSNHSTNADWYYTTEQHTVDNTRWRENIALYDPCPAGWTLPKAGLYQQEGLWHNALGQDTVFLTDWDENNKGYDFTGLFGDAKSIWYPLSGKYALEDGRLYPLFGIIIWACDIPADESAIGLYCFNDAQKHLAVCSTYNFYRAEAFPTRCVAVK